MRQKIIYAIILVFFLGINTIAKSQTDISLSTHWNNRANYNPASIARTDYIYLFSNVRKQWENISGAPTVFNVQASGYVDKLNSALGISLVSDKIGLTQAINPMITYAYRISNDDTWSLSMGLSGGVFSRTLDGSLFDPLTLFDPLLYNNQVKILQPDANAGIEFQSINYIFGIASTHLFSIGKNENLFLNSNHRYVYAIYKNTDLLMFNYNFGLKVENRYNITDLEVNGEIRFKHSTGLTTGPREMISIGLTYRTSQQMTFLFGVNITPDFRVGYAYDLNLVPGYYRNSTNEIMLEYRIPTNERASCALCRKDGNWYD